MAFKHHVNTHRKSNQARRIKNAMLFLAVLVLLATAGIGVDWFLNRVSTSNTIVTNETTSSVQASSVSVYRSPYFQFQAPDQWVAQVNLTSENKYTYVRNNESVVDQRLVVYVNRPEVNRDADLKITRALPISANVSGLFEEVGKVSSHCDESWPDGLKRNPRRIVHEDMSFVCSIGSTQYNVVLAEKGGDENIDVISQDGSDVSLTIVFSNLTAYPSPGDLYIIAESFSTL